MGKHFEIIVCVCKPGLQSQRGCCKVSEKTGYSSRSRMMDVVVVESDKTAVRCNAEFVDSVIGVGGCDEVVKGASEVMSSRRSVKSEYLRQKQRTQDKTNMLLREKCQFRIRKIYHENQSIINQTLFIKCFSYIKCNSKCFT